MSLLSLSNCFGALARLTPSSRVRALRLTQDRSRRLSKYLIELSARQLTHVFVFLRSNCIRTSVNTARQYPECHDSAAKSKMLDRKANTRTHTQKNIIPP